MTSVQGVHTVGCTYYDIDNYEVLHQPVLFIDQSHPVSPLEAATAEILLNKDDCKCVYLSVCLSVYDFVCLCCVV